MGVLRSLVVVSVREGRRAVTTTPVIQSGRFTILNKITEPKFRVILWNLKPAAGWG